MNYIEKASKMSESERKSFELQVVEVYLRHIAQGMIEDDAVEYEGEIGCADGHMWKVKIKRGKWK